MQFQSFEEAKVFLQKTSSSSSLSIYDHLSDVIQRVLRDPNDKAYDNLETISMLVKAERLNLQRSPEGFTFDATPEIKDARNRSARETLALFPSPSAPDADEPAEPSSAIVSDVIAESDLLRWAGVGLGDEDTYRLHLGIQRLSNQIRTATSIRYFGQFAAMTATYTVCEVSGAADPDEVAVDAEARAEPHGQGANAFVYYVTTSKAFGTWTKLPDVLPEHIRISRQMKRLLTGDLDAAVRGSPHFRWTEAAYLRALIARISASTTIAPSGMFELKEEENSAGPTVSLAEEFQMPAAGELANPDAWVHRYGALLQQGRMTPFVKEPAEEDAEAEKTDKAEAESPAEEQEEAIPPLRSISEDESGPWSFRSYGGGGPNPIVAVRSAIWPGALTVIKGNTFVSVYVGDGQRQLTRVWQPALPLPFQKEFKDDEEEPKLRFQEDPLPPPVTEPEPAESAPAEPSPE